MIPYSVNLNLWIFKQTERDVIKLYNSFTPYIRTAVNDPNDYMLNFGYWTKNNIDPVAAQYELSAVVGKFGKFDTAELIADVGSGFSAPAVQWSSEYPHLRILCIDINYKEMSTARKMVISTPTSSDRISLINASSRMLPFRKDKIDTIIAFESAQHFQSINNFLEVSRSILKPDGFIVIAIPVLDFRPLEHKDKNQNGVAEKIRLIKKLGILYFSWASQHYDMDTISRSIINHGYQIEELQRIGHQVYEPSAEYYFTNRENIKHRLIQSFATYKQRMLFELVELLVYKSALKMKDLSVNGILDYVLIRAKKGNLPGVS
ncbi:MAG TPA: class I SAM-dependent methyltransferase [Nitrososphaeraceae archaeon]|nr:class I SAM-dependent methyltransferase [Nitrososphaeraceae archaeon]